MHPSSLPIQEQNMGASFQTQTAVVLRVRHPILAPSKGFVLHQRAIIFNFSAACQHQCQIASNPRILPGQPCRELQLLRQFQEAVHIASSKSM